MTAGTVTAVRGSVVDLHFPETLPLLHHQVICTDKLRWRVSGDRCSDRRCH
ncbi:hypothetical protein IQ254_24400 [Nodosilinea sp. LEGE 07088]|uniref:hypothetical protein n=1 Tax=Nodosilinea sp. LEGE 07088 TaxID=2777968 RepID=UPI00187E1952|nr:hypothetical protein [Nodosilinea sp. LEGE 07088]MBE9140300.1 hypothetical protein [Nodosilinea sp. LEGE 07088]